MIRALTPEEAPDSRRDRPVVDVRDDAAFAAGHVPGSGHVPFAALRERRVELPARDVPVLLVGGSAAEAEAAARALEDMGVRDVAYLAAPIGALEDGRASTDPPARLWRPAPFLEAMLPRLPRGRALDVACGNGRESVFLALAGFDVEAWDHAPEALAQAESLARRHGTRITTRVVNLEDRTLEFPESRWDVIVCFRFLHRPLFPRLERGLRPGGCLVYETFRVGQERFGRPLRRQFLLTNGELSSAFPSLAVEHYAEHEQAGGPVTARLLARRPLEEEPRR